MQPSTSNSSSSKSSSWGVYKSLTFKDNPLLNPLSDVISLTASLEDNNKENIEDRHRYPPASAAAAAAINARQIYHNNYKKSQLKSCNRKNMKFTKIFSHLTRAVSGGSPPATQDTPANKGKKTLCIICSIH